MKLSYTAWPAVLAATIFWTGAVTAQPAGQQASERDHARAVADGYLANREAFTDFSCDFELTAGWADNPMSARDGRLHDAMSGRGVWRVARNKVRLELICDRSAWDRAYNEARSKSPTNFSVAIPLLSQVYLSDGERQLTYNSFANIGDLFPPQDPSPGADFSPWDMIIFGPGETKSPARRIQDALGRDQYCHLESVSAPGGMLTRISLGKSATDLSCRMDLDPERGYLPVQFEQFLDGGKTVAAQILTTDMRQAGNGHWFPFRTVMTALPAPNQPIPVKIWQVARLELGAPAEDEFQSQLSKGARLCNNVDPASGFWAGQTERVGPGDLPALLERSNRAAQAQHAKEAKAGKRAAVPGEAHVVQEEAPAAPSVWPARVGLLSVAFLLAIATYVAVKTIQSRRKAQGRV